MYNQAFHDRIIMSIKTGKFSFANCDSIDNHIVNTKLWCVLCILLCIPESVEFGENY